MEQKAYHACVRHHCGSQYSSGILSAEGRKPGNWHLYFINGLNGLMNTIQQPASDVAVSLLTPKKQYQRVSGMRSFSNSLITVLNPIAAMTVMSFWGIGAVIAIDLTTFRRCVFYPCIFYPDPGEQAGIRGAAGFSYKSGRGRPWDICGRTEGSWT